jgi:4,5-DOPA dioxygenase extradiol
VLLCADGAPLVYDFGGFAERYYRMTYATPPATALAQRVAAMLPDTEPVHQHPSRGLDHGAWVPLKIMYPDGDIPVLQMSLPTSDPQRLLALGERLRPLRDEGVLIIGSGFLTHGLPFLTDWRLDAAAPGWSKDFDAWAGEALARGDVDALASYRSQAPGMPYAHPTVEHYTPLFVTLGAATDSEEPGQQLFEGFWMGLSKRSLQVA